MSSKSQRSNPASHRLTSTSHRYGWGLSSIIGLSLMSSSAEARVLLVGDSHSVGQYGRELERLFREKNGSSEVALYASCGSAPQTWISGRATRCGFRQKVGTQKEVSAKTNATPKLPQIVGAWLEPGEKHIVVISLGANLVPASTHQAQRQTRDFLNLLQTETSGQEIQCYWVGAPTSRTFSAEKTARTVDVMRAQIGSQCEYIDSREFTAYPARGGDGIHFDSLGASGRKIAIQWAQAVFQRIPQTSSSASAEGDSAAGDSP